MPASYSVQKVISAYVDDRPFLVGQRPEDLRRVVHVVPAPYPTRTRRAVSVSPTFLAETPVVPNACTASKTIGVEEGEKRGRTC